MTDVDHRTNLNQEATIFLFLKNYPWKIECFLEDLFLGGQSSIILGYRRLSVKSGPLLVVVGVGIGGVE